MKIQVPSIFQILLQIEESMRNIDSNQALEIYKVNNLIRGAFIEKGKNTYVLSYNPIENRLGSIISFVSFIILISLFFSGFKNEKQ